MTLSVTPKPRKGLKRSTKPMKRSPMKNSRPKTSKIRQSAKGQDCTIILPMVCNSMPETVVLCHSNQLKDGKGIGLKAPDTKAAYGCSSCHDVIDGRAPRPPGMSYEEMLQHFNRGILKTNEILQKKGLMK